MDRSQQIRRDGRGHHSINRGKEAVWEGGRISLGQSQSIKTPTPISIQMHIKEYAVSSIDSSCDKFSFLSLSLS